MNPSRWRQIQALFEAAVDLDGGEAAALLDRGCPDEEVRREVEALLRNSSQAESYFEASLAPVARQVLQQPAEPLPGERIGHYQIIRRIGQGGMGSVFLAIRADREFEMKVAIKVMRGAMATPALIEQFRSERRILARLEHPHIARLLDAGLTEAGLPYVVMEYVDGLPVTKYLDQARSTIEERLRMFQLVCSAVHHAHQRLVVHRDIKPGNIFVTADGVPKLLDFGVAKLLSRDEELAGATTSLIGRAMTPEYASPEQVRGEKVATSSDIYSLGILLTELLAGRTPFADTGRGIAPGPVPEKLEAMAPSRALLVARSNGAAEEIAHCRRTTVKKLRRSLRGDLDTIAETATRQEPDRRYPSVDQFSSDIARHLASFPIAARPDRWSYRAAKYVRRNRWAVTAGVLLAAALLTAAVLGHKEHLETERRLATMIAYNQANQTDVLDGIQDLPGSMSLRRRIVDISFHSLRDLLHEAPNDARAIENYAVLLRRASYLNYGRGRQHLGNSTAALDYADQAMSILEGFVQREPANPDRQIALVHVYAQSSDLRTATARDLGRVRQLFDQEEAVLRNLALRNWNPRAVHWQFAHLMIRRARHDLDEGDWQNAQKHAADAAGQFHAMIGHYVEDPDYALYESMSLVIAAEALLAGGRPEQAATQLQPARDVLERSHRESPVDIPALARVLYMRQISARVYATLQECRAATSQMEDTRRIADEATRWDRQSKLGDELLANTLETYGEVLRACGSGKEGSSLLEQALTVRSALAKHDPANVAWRGKLERVQRLLGSR